MVGCGMFNFINLRLQEITGVREPFGGVSIIAVGDLFQLIPVMDRLIFSQPSVDYGPIAVHFWKDNFKMFELTQIMTQRVDKLFAELLYRLREGYHTDQDIEKLREKMSVEKPEYESVQLLFTTRKEIETFNCSVFTAAEENLKQMMFKS